MVGIYKITSPSGRVYIGQSFNIKERKRQYKHLNCKAQPKLYNSFIKYGFTNHEFDIVTELPKDVNTDVINNYEQLVIVQYKEAGIKLLNIRDAGSNGRPSKESIEKMVATRKRNGSYATPDHVREQRRQRNLGKPLKGVTREHILQTAEKLRGRKQPEWHKEKNRQAQLGRKHSEETRKLMSENAKILWANRKQNGV